MTQNPVLTPSLAGPPPPVAESDSPAASATPATGAPATPPATTAAPVKKKRGSIIAAFAAGSVLLLGLGFGGGIAVGMAVAPTSATQQAPDGLFPDDGSMPEGGPGGQGMQ